MKQMMIGGVPFSQMSLGTVQLGLDYGIANQSGKPSLQQSHEVLQTAINGGVTALDTAAAYGDSEQVIGDFLRQRGGKGRLFLTTKFLLDVPDGAPDVLVKSEIRASLERSLERLGVDRVDCLMLHRAEYFKRFPDATTDALAEAIREGLVGRAGVSIYAPDDLAAALQTGIVSMVQAPMSLFDHALSESPYMDVIRAQGIALIARSVFFQGLLFLDPDTITDEDLLAAAAPKLRLIRSIAQEAGISMEALAIAYIRDMPGVTSIVLGAENAWQVAQNLQYFAPDAPTLSPQVRAQIDQTCQADVPRIMSVLSRAR